MSNIDPKNIFGASDAWIQDADGNRIELPSVANFTLGSGYKQQIYLTPSLLQQAVRLSDEDVAGVADYLNHQMERRILFVHGPIVSTATNTAPQEMPDIDTLERIYAQLRDRDPLLQLGVQRDWVCVLNPALVYPIEQEFDRLYPTGSNYDGVPYPRRKLDDIMGRRVWQIPDAPLDRVEYMPEGKMFRRYAHYFAMLAEVAKATFDEQWLRELKMLTMQARRAMADGDRERNGGGQGI